MHYSDYNVIVELDKHPRHAVVQNLFHGRTSVVSREIATALRSRTLSPSQAASLKKRGFIYDSEDDEKALIEEVHDIFRNALPAGNPSRQYQIILTYDCNLRCIYCFQKEVRKSAEMKRRLSQAQLEAILAFVDEMEARNQRDIDARGLKTRIPLVSVVGGEPLADDPAHFDMVAAIAGFAKERGFHYSITTNGVHLGKYLDLFSRVGLPPRDVQVTVDGPAAYHDKRRVALGGGGSFEAIARSVSAALAAGLRVSLRVNTDLMNIDMIPDLAALMEAREWFRHAGFSAYIAPVTDHSVVNRNYRWMAEADDLIRRVVEMFRARPELADRFTMKNFRGFEYVRRSLDADETVAPTIWRCEAVLGHYVFDPAGKVYTCFEGAGNALAEIGTYFPEMTINPDKQARWQRLNAIENPVCGPCRFRFVCAGGCPWHIVGQGKPECLPIEQEVALAWNYYLSPREGAAPADLATS